MPGLYEYTISMNDKASGTLQKLTGSSYETVNRFVQLQDKTDSLRRHISDFGNGISSLKQKIDILQSERDLIDPQNLPKIQQYNREIAALNGQITDLETTTGGSKMGKNLKDAFNQVPGAAMLTNPIVLAGAGVAAVGKLGVSWGEGMAKINATAQLPKEGLDALSSEIKKLGINAGANLSKVPDAYEKIISQTGDVALSTDILATSLQGAKAGFTDVDVVAAAVGQSLSAIGKGKETAAEVMDVLFASKRVGAGEFADFANNIPSLIASGQNVGATFREVSGAFAYMTGKGNDASSSTMLLQNAFTALGKSEITGGLKAAGVEVYDAEGKMRGILPIMEDLSGVMNGMSDKERSDFLESIGLRDAQAKQAFSVLTNDTDKLREAMNATANASGELQAALDNTDNPANKMREAWAKIQGIGLSLSVVVLSVLNPALNLLGALLAPIGAIAESIGTAWMWWTNAIQQGNPFIIAITTALGVLTAVVVAHNLWLQKEVIWTKAANQANGIKNSITKVSTALQWAYNSAAAIGGAVMTWLKKRIEGVRGAMVGNSLATGLMTIAMGAAAFAARAFGVSIRAMGKAIYSVPIIGWIAAAISALIALFTLLWNRSEKFRGFLFGLWGSVKAIFHNIGVFMGIVYQNLIKPVFDWIGEKITWLKDTVLAPMGSFFAGVWEGIASGLDGLGQRFSGVWDWITGILERVGLRFTSFWEFTKSLFMLGAKILFWPFTLLFKLFPDLGAWIEEKVWGPIKAVFEKITQRIGKLIEPIKKVWGKLFKGEEYKDVSTAYTEGDEKGKQHFRDEKASKAKKDSGGIGDLMANIDGESGASKLDISSFSMDKGQPQGQPQGKQNKLGSRDENTPALGVPTYNQSSNYTAIAAKFGSIPATIDGTEAKTENTTDKPVKSIATRVDEISGSLKKMAAAVALPVALTIGAANAAPVQPENDLFAHMAQTSEVYDSGANAGEVGREAINRVSTAKIDHGKTITIDRFTDKIEIHIHASTTQAGKEVAENVRYEVEKALAEILNV